MTPHAGAPPGNTRWRFFSFLFGMAFLGYALRQDIQVAGQYMMPAFGLGEIEMGWIYSAFVWGYALFQLPSGLLGERFGPRRVLAWAGVLWLLTSAATGFLPGLFESTAAVVAALMIVRFLVGVVHAPTFPLQAAAIAAWFPVGRWGLPNALSSAGLTLGAAAAQPLVVWVMMRWGWQAAFYLYIPIGLVLFAAWWRYARDDPAEHPRVGAAELALIRRGRDSTQAASAAEHGAWKRLLRNRETLLITGAYFSMNIVFYLFFTWAFHYFVKVRGFSLLETGFMAALPWLTGAFTAPLGGWCCDVLCARLGPRWGCRIPGAGGMFLTALFLAAGLQVDDAYLAVALLSLCFASTQFTEAAYWQAQTYVAPTHVASATGIMNTGANIAGMIVGPLIPWLAQSLGWTLALGSGVVFALLGALLWLNVRADQSLPPLPDTAPT